MAHLYLIRKQRARVKLLLLLLLLGTTEHAGAVASLLHSFRSRRAAILQSIDALARALNDPSSSSEEELNDGNGAADARVDGENAARIDADFDLDDRLKGRGSRFQIQIQQIQIQLGEESGDEPRRLASGESRPECSHAHCRIRSTTRHEEQHHQ